MQNNSNAGFEPDFSQPIGLCVKFLLFQTVRIDGYAHFYILHFRTTSLDR